MSANKIYKGSATKDGRCYYFRKSKNNKQYTSKKYKTREECEKALSLFVLKNDNPINKRFDLVADDYFNNLMKYSKSSTVLTYMQDYNKHILPYFGNSYINRINTSDIRKWADTIENMGYSVAYLNKILNIVKNIFNFAIKNYNVNSNPVMLFGNFKEKNDKVIDDNKKLRYITLEDFNKFISVIDSSLWKTFFITAFYTGCRKGELIALLWSDIDFDKNEISISKTLYARNSTQTDTKELITSTKTNKNRKIKMSKLLSKTLLEYKKQQENYKDFNDNWFVFGGPIYISPSTIARHKHYYFNLSGVSEITMHEFRHSHVSLLINEYVKNCEKLNSKVDSTKFFIMMADRMGHSISVMQNVYMHLFPTMQDEIVNLLDNL